MPERKALEEVFPDTRHQRCWFHKIGRVLNHFPKSMQPAVASGLRDIHHAETRAAALAALEVFKQKYATKYERGGCVSACNFDPLDRVIGVQF